MTRTMKKLLSEKIAASGHIRNFRREEEGGMILFSLFMLVLILTLAGMAVDLMRFETTRAKLQGTLDRATLAAADLDQTLPPADVVRDYFTKAGMIDFLDGNPVVDDGLNYRIVTANAEAEMPMFFSELPRVLMTPFSPGLGALTVSGNSTAEERVTDVEISLVLDVSGSMARNNRIQNLRPAAREFVTTVMANNTNAPQGLITISMIPYSAVVNPGTEITPFLNINETHEYSSCLLFDDALFTSTALNLSNSYDHVSHFDPDWYSDDPEPIGYPWCHVGDHNSIMPVSSDEAELHNRIDDLEPYGNTAIDLGMKWGVALLDPSTRSAISSLANANGTSVPQMAAGRPSDHNQPSVLKVVVLMTDGSNTQEYDLVEPYKSGISYVWFNTTSTAQGLQTVSRENISVQIDGLGTPLDYTDDEFYTHVATTSERYTDYPAGFSSQSEYVASRLANQGAILAPGIGPIYNNVGTSGSNVVRNAAWQELYATWTHNRVNNELLARAYNAGAIPWDAGTSGYPNYIQLADYRDADSAIDYSVVNSGEADDRLSDICQAARAEGIIIYTVAFEAPSGGQTALQDCASSASHYFDVDGTDIADAFSAIASDIRALKLTQ